MSCIEEKNTAPPHEYEQAHRRLFFSEYQQLADNVIKYDNDYIHCNFCIISVVSEAVNKCEHKCRIQNAGKQASGEKFRRFSHGGETFCGAFKYPYAVRDAGKRDRQNPCDYVCTEVRHRQQIIAYLLCGNIDRGCCRAEYYI